MRARKICIAGTPVAVSAATIGYTCAKNQWAKLLGELANSGLGDACTQNVTVTFADEGGMQLKIRCMKTHRPPTAAFRTGTRKSSETKTQKASQGENDRKFEFACTTTATTI
jgi:hypothetical protein